MKHIRKHIIIGKHCCVDKYVRTFSELGAHLATTNETRPHSENYILIEQSCTYVYELGKLSS